MRKKRFGILIVFVIILIITSIIIAKNNMYPETEAANTTSSTITVTYKVGNGTGENITLTQTITDKQSYSTSDYTDNKIIFYSNGEEGIDFDGGTVTCDSSRKYTKFRHNRYKCRLNKWRWHIYI